MRDTKAMVRVNSEIMDAVNLFRVRASERSAKQARLRRAGRYRIAEGIGRKVIVGMLEHLRRIQRRRHHVVESDDGERWQRMRELVVLVVELRVERGRYDQ